MNARDYLTLLRERKLLIGACVAAGLVLAVVVTFLMPTKYASSATFYVVANSGSSPTSAASDNYQGAQLATGRVKSYTELLTGERVAQDAAAALGGGTTPQAVLKAVSATSVEDTVIVTLTATDTSPARAQQIARAVSTSFTTLVRRLETTGTPAAPAPTPAGAPAPAPAPATQPAVSAEVLQPPNLPVSPVSPSLPLNLAIGLLVGLLAGFGAAVVKRSLDSTVRSAEELAEVVGAPVLGTVPEDRDAGRTPASLTSGAGGYARAEAFHRIRTTLQSRSAGGGTHGIGRVLVVTSAVSGEGRTSVACNLAAALAAVGSRVVLVDGDLRKPGVARYLGLKGAVGLTTVLAHQSTFANAIQSWSDDGLAVLVSGAHSPHPNEVVASRSMGNLVAWLRPQYEYVIIDTPPVLAVADAANLATHADGVVLVSRWGVTERPELESAVSFLRSVSVPVVGTILSRTPERRAAGTARYAEYVPAETAAAPATPRPAESRGAVPGETTAVTAEPTTAAPEPRTVTVEPAAAPATATAVAAEPKATTSTGPLRTIVPLKAAPTEPKAVTGETPAIAPGPKALDGPLRKPSPRKPTPTRQPQGSG